MVTTGGTVTLDPDQLNETDAGILDLLRVGRVTPRYAAGELDRQQPYINQRLKRLLEHEHVRRVDRGLYELVDDPRGEQEETTPRDQAVVDEDQERDERADGRRGRPPRGPDELRPGEDPPETLLSDDQEAMLRERLAGSGAKLDGRVDAVRAMYGRLLVLGEAEKDELLGPVNIEATGYAHADSVWSNVVKGKDTLAALPGVEKPGAGMSTWRYTDDRE